MTDATSFTMARTKPLADFRYELRKFLSFSEASAERHGVATQQYQLMQVIAAMPEDKVPSITYLADRMVLRHNSMVELVDRAERAGLVKRSTDATDLRRSIVTLTDEGNVVLERMVREHLQELRSMGPQLIDALREALDQAVSAEEAVAP